MTERNRSVIEFLGWNRGYLPGYRGLRTNPPEPVSGVWLRRRVGGRRILYTLGPRDPYTDAEAGAILGVTRQTIRNWRRSGKLRAKQRQGIWYYAYSEIRDLAKQLGRTEKVKYLVN